MPDAPPLDPTVDAILAVARALASTFELDELLERILETVSRVVDAERSTLFLVDAETGELRTQVAQGTARKDMVLAPDTGIAGWVARHGTSVRLDDAYADPRFYAAWDDETGYRTRALLCVPFRSSDAGRVAGGRVVGVMQCLNKPGGFTPNDQTMLEAIGHQCALAIDNATLVSRLEQRNQELARTHAQLRRKAEELEILVELERAIAHARGEEAVLREALALVCSLFETSEASALVVGDPSQVVSVQTRDRGEARDRASLRVRLRTRRISREWADALLLRADGPILSGTDGSREASVAIEVGGQRIGLLQITHLTDVADSGLRVLSLVGARVGQAIGALREEAVHDRNERLTMLGQMMSGVIHDLRTPISAIGGYAELMSDEPDPDERGYYLSRIRTGLSQLEAMTTEVLEFSRGSWDLALEEVDVREFVGSVRQVVMPDIDRFGAVLVVEGELDQRARFDPNRLRRVLSNLARNAGEAGARTIRWKVDRDREWLAFTVADDGPGISDAIRHRLFQPFATHGKSGGTGLGLAMAKKIVEAHGGTIEVGSDPGGGASFRIALPG